MEKCQNSQKIIKNHVQQLQVTGKPSSKMFPSTCTLPRVLTRPANTFSSEVLPAPEGPINAHTSPPLSEPLMSFRMVFFCLPISTVICTDRHEKLEPFFPSSRISGDTAFAIAWSKDKATRSRTGRCDGLGRAKCFGAFGSCPNSHGGSGCGSKSTRVYTKIVNGC